jgi:hypothetical protein
MGDPRWWEGCFSLKFFKIVEDKSANVDRSGNARPWVNRGLTMNKGTRSRV